MKGVLPVGAIIAWAAFSGPASAQSALERARDIFTTCARSVAPQYAVNTPREMAVEMAFQACVTEERLLFSALVSSGASLPVVSAGMASFKFKLKQDILSWLP